MVGDRGSAGTDPTEDARNEVRGPSDERHISEPLATTAPQTDGVGTPASLSVGRVVAGKYRLLRMVGRGGMGAVYEAQQLDLDRRVAVKVLGADYSRRSELIQRFEREARLAAAIGHENIVAIHDVGRSSDDEPFIVMELLEGSSMR